MIMHAGLFPAARGNEILIGKPMRLDMDQGYPGHSRPPTRGLSFPPRTRISL